MRTSADAFPVVGGRCTGRARRCKAKQGRREDGTDVWILTSTVVRFWGRVKSGEDFFGNQARPLPAHLLQSLQGIAETDRTPLRQRRVRISNSGGDCFVFPFSFPTQIPSDPERENDGG
jgi:hypothetical protein